MSVCAIMLLRCTIDYVPVTGFECDLKFNFDEVIRSSDHADL